MTKKILWCVTGAGEFLKESMETMAKVDYNLTIYVSRAAEEVLRSYQLLRELKKTFNVELETDYSSSKAGKVTLGEYEKIVVSPATANTVAKIANGIADNLVTTAVSLGLKSGVCIYVVPTDWVSKKTEIPGILTPGGSLVHMKPRKADLRNIKYLEDEGIKVLEDPQKLLLELK